MSRDTFLFLHTLLCTVSGLHYESISVTLTVCKKIIIQPSVLRVIRLSSVLMC